MDYDLRFTVYGLRLWDKIQRLDVPCFHWTCIIIFMQDSLTLSPPFHYYHFFISFTLLISDSLFKHSHSFGSIRIESSTCQTLWPLPPFPSWMWFNLWYRPIFGARRFNPDPLLTAISLPTGVDVVVHISGRNTF
jgi:hypothetical protein